MKREHIWAHHEQDANNNWKLAEGGYASRDSVRVGESLTLHISNSRSYYSVFIFREGADRRLVHTIDNLRGELQPVPEHGYRDGFGWEVTTELKIDEHWQPGIYFASFPTAQGNREIMFVVRPKQRAAPLLLTISTNTYQAYNNVGGKCLYDYISTDRQRTDVVSFDRPMQADCHGNFYIWDQFYISWLESEGYEVDYCVNSDFDAEPNLLDGYKATMRIGHDEYNSEAEIVQLEQFVDRGGNLLLLAGNSIYWRVSMLDGLRQMSCPKPRYHEPPDPDKPDTGRWSDGQLRRQKLLGLHYTSFINAKTDTPGVFLAPTTDNYGFYKIVDADHWIFTNTALKNGDELGRDDSIVGVEADAADLVFENGHPRLTGVDGANTDFRILAIADAKVTDARELNPANDNTVADAYGLISINESPDQGTVFVAATIEWGHGLYRDDNPVSVITRNVLNRLAR